MISDRLVHVQIFLTFSSDGLFKSWATQSVALDISKALCKVYPAGNYMFKVNKRNARTGC